MGNPIVHVEFSSRKAEELKRFYEGLFGWKFQHDPAMRYWSFATGAEPGGGLYEDEAMPPGVQVYVGVDDVDAALKKAESLGATVMRWREPIPTVGWFGMFRDPEGIMMAVFQSEHPHPHPPEAAPTPAKPAARKAKAKAKAKARSKPKRGARAKGRKPR